MAVDHRKVEAYLEGTKDACEYDIKEVDVAYLKAINIPSMFDVGTINVDPTDSRLLLNVMDDHTYYKVIKPDFLCHRNKQSKRKISKFRSAIQACHTNMYVSEVVITVKSVSKFNLKTKQRTKYFDCEKDPYSGVEIPLTIDGKTDDNNTKTKVKRIVINRLMTNDGEHASIPV